MLVPDCGHMCTLERPEAVTQALLAWHARSENGVCLPLAAQHRQ